MAGMYWCAGVAEQICIVTIPVQSKPSGKQPCHQFLLAFALMLVASCWSVQLHPSEMHPTYRYCRISLHPSNYTPTICAMQVCRASKQFVQPTSKSTYTPYCVAGLQSSWAPDHQALERGHSLPELHWRGGMVC